MTINQLHSLFLESTGVCTDTRKVQQKQLFFALKGDNFNGNEYAMKALNAGASFAIVDEAAYATDKRCLLVKDVLTTLQDLAAFHRTYLGIPIIGITGSNGKTTTKELLRVVLSQKMNVFATAGNLNNHIGVPLSLLSMTNKHEFAIIEMGANHQKEIEGYCAWVKPNYGLISNIGKAHLEGFGGIEGVIKGKTELFIAVQENNGTVFYNGDDPILEAQSNFVQKRLSYGTAPNSFYPYQILNENNFIGVQIGDVTIQSNMLGQYNGVNIAAALAVGQYFEVDVMRMKDAIESYTPDNNRSQITQYKGNEVILDAYNANPTSMLGALLNFENYKAGSKGVFLGDMFEVGETSAEEHQAIVAKLEMFNFDFCVLVGANFYAHKNEAYHFFPTTEEAKAWFEQQAFTNYTFLVKGSRGMKMERLLA